MKELTVDATIENVAAVTAFVDEQLEQLDCPIKTQCQVDVAIDELFGNIANYAYNPDIGYATVRVEVTENPLAVVITFIDNGVRDRRVGYLHGEKIHGRYFLRIQGWQKYSEDQEKHIKERK